VQVFILKMVRSSQNNVFASGFLCPSHPQLLEMVNASFGRLAARVAQQGSAPCKTTGSALGEGAGIETVGADRSVMERRGRRSWPADIAHDTISGTMCKYSLLLESFE
jgi:hypothetical protein